MITITDGQTDVIVDDIHEDFFWDDRHYQSMKDTLETFDFTTFADKPFSEHLTKNNRIIIPGEDGELLEFIIQNTRKYRDTNGGLFMDVYTSASYIELRTVKVIRPQTLQGATAKSAAEFAVAGTEWQVGQVDYAGIRTIPIENHTNPYSLLKQIASEFGLELRFHIEHDGNQITGRYVDLIERVGMWRGREVEFGKDLIGIERKEDFSNIVTALIGLGPEREDGTRLEVFVEDKDALARWGRNGQHIIEVYEPQSTDTEMTESRLRELTQNELEKRVNSVVEYVGDIADLEKVPGIEHEKIRFGDTIKIKDTGFDPPLYLEARVHTQERSIKKSGRKTVVLGDYIEYTEEEVKAIWKSLQAQIAKKISMSDVMEVVYTKQEVDDKDAGVYQDSTYYADNVSETKKQEAIQVAATDATNKANTAEQNAKSYTDIIKSDLEDGIQQAQTTADGKNSVFHSSTAPPTTGRKIGDIWFDTSRDNLMHRFNGVEWVEAKWGERSLAAESVTALHIKSLEGLNVNDQFIVDSNGNVKFAGTLNGANGTFNGAVVVTSSSTDEHGNATTETVNIEQGKVTANHHVDVADGLYTIDNTVMIERGGIILRYSDVGYELDGETETYIYNNIGGLTIDNTLGNNIELLAQNINLYGTTHLKSGSMIVEAGNLDAANGIVLGGAFRFTRIGSPPASSEGFLWYGNGYQGKGLYLHIGTGWTFIGP